MALTRSFRDTVLARARHDAEFRMALFEEALQALLDGDMDEAKNLLRDCINATIGFEALAGICGLPIKSLMRMVGPRGNPTLRNFVVLVQAIQGEEGFRTQARVFNPALPSLGAAVADTEAVAGSTSSGGGANLEVQVPRGV